MAVLEASVTMVKTRINAWIFRLQIRNIVLPSFQGSKTKLTELFNYVHVHCVCVHASCWIWSSLVHVVMILLNFLSGTSSGVAVRKGHQISTNFSDKRGVPLGITSGSRWVLKRNACPTKLQRWLFSQRRRTSRADTTGTRHWTRSSSPSMPKRVCQSCAPLKQMPLM